MKLNPLRWSNRALRVFFTAVFTIFLPLYLFVGFQPRHIAGAEGYPTLEIPSINLTTHVEGVELENRELKTPAFIAGSFSLHPNKILLIGHSSTVFKHLTEVKIGDIITYDNETYHITKQEILEKTTISMNAVLADAEQKTLIIMTCAGQPLPNQDATHRLLVTAVKD